MWKLLTSVLCLCLLLLSRPHGVGGEEDKTPLPVSTLDAGASLLSPIVSESDSGGGSQGVVVNGSKDDVKKSPGDNVLTATEGPGGHPGGVEVKDKAVSSSSAVVEDDVDDDDSRFDDAKLPTALPPAAAPSPSTSLLKQPVTGSNILILSSLSGTLTSLDPSSGLFKWSSTDNPSSPMINVPSQAQSTNPANHLFLPDPKTGNLYIYSNKKIRKLPLTIPQLVAMAPCKNSEGLMYTGKKVDYWIGLNPLTGEKNVVDGSCPAETGSSGGAEEGDDSNGRCSKSNPLLNKLLIGKTEYTLSMQEGLSKWNVSYHHYSSLIYDDSSLDTYPYVHFTSPSTGIIMTYSKHSGSLLWQTEMDSPIIAVYTVDRTGTNLISLPFNPIASETLTRLKNNSVDTKLKATTFIGESNYGNYAVGVVGVDEAVRLIENEEEDKKEVPLIEGPEGGNASGGDGENVNTTAANDKKKIVYGYYANVDDGKTKPSVLQIQQEDDSKVIKIDDNVILLPHGHFNDTRNDSSVIIEPLSPPPQPQPIPKPSAKILLTTAVASVAVTVVIIVLTALVYRRYSSASSSRNPSKSVTIDPNSEYLSVGKISFNPAVILGKGCEGTFVYKGAFESRSVAVKRILPDCFSIADREVTLLKLSDQHPNVIRYYCTEADSQFRYIALELCEATLADWIEGRWNEAELDAVNVLQEATEGLRHLHSLRIVHRDVKPANVLINVNNGVVRVVISDFGLCKKLREDKSFSKDNSVQSSRVAGTDGWIAPEVLKGYKKLSPKTMIKGQASQTFSVDIFSLGCVYYYVLTNGHHPFSSETDPFRRQSNILHGNFSLDLLNSKYNTGVMNLIQLMISSDPSQRPPLKDVAKHPFFWKKEKILAFFLDVSDRIEKEDEVRCALLRRLERNGRKVVRTDWREHICEEVVLDLRKYRSYRGESVRDLLRALRNKKNHYRELTLDAQRSLGSIPDQFTDYWITRFPDLLEYTWLKFEGCREESVFHKYYGTDKDAYSFDLHINEEEDENEENNLNFDEEEEQQQPGSNPGSPGKKSAIDKNFWRSKSQFKYQQWRKKNSNSRVKDLSNVNYTSFASRRDNGGGTNNGGAGGGGGGPSQADADPSWRT